MPQHIAVPEGKVLVTTLDEGVLSTPQSDVTKLEPCTHEEADYRMMLHTADAYHKGHQRIMVHATDTDVLVLAITTASVLPGCKLWIAFGHGNKFRYIAAHTIAAYLGAEKSHGLLFLHAFTGCDSVSAFCSIGKKTAWQVWQSMHHLDPVFKALSQLPSQITDDAMVELERFVVVLYSRTSSLNKVNDARKHLFAYGNRKMDNIPPSRDALLQHVKRAAYQAGHIWGQALTLNPILPSPSDWGWISDTDGHWSPIWTTLPEASKGCRELVRCNCRKSCLGRCKCFKSNLKCTQLCFCAGQCPREQQ